MQKEDRFYEQESDWLKIVDDGEPPKVEKGRFIQDPTTGLLQGSEPGPGHGEGEGGETTETAVRADDKGTPINEAKVPKGSAVKDLSDFTNANITLASAVTSEQSRRDGLITVWNDRVGRSPEQFRKEFFGNDTVKGSMKINYHPWEDAIKVSTSVQDKDGEEVGQMDASIYVSENRVHMDYYRLDSSEQKHGIMKTIMAEQMSVWQDMGIETIDMLANIDVGGYAWARYGFEPEKDAWPSLSGELETKIERMGEGKAAGPGAAGNWDELSVTYQSRVMNSWMRDTYQEYYESEVQNWRDTGQPLEQAKVDLVGEFNTSESVHWAHTTIENYIKHHQEDAPVPFTTQQIISSISLLYKSEDKDGQGELDVYFNNDKLTEPSGPMPGQKAGEPHEYLTEKMRKDITRLLRSRFDDRAYMDMDDIAAPDTIPDKAVAAQQDAWNDMPDADRFEWADENRPDLVGGAYSRPPGTGEMTKAEATAMLKLTRSDDPRALWPIADSKWGFKLLTWKNWNGKLDMNDKEQMERFTQYVSKAKK